MKIAVIGGTFDPFHNGHLAVCEAICALPDVDRVLLVPAVQSPFKPDETPTPGAIRLEMAEAATRSLRKCAVSGVELSRPAPSYTIDTLEELARAHPGDRFALVVGADQWAGFAGWKDCDKILAGYELITTTRAGCRVPEEAPGRRVPVRDVPVSSTQLRRQVAQGQPVEAWIPAPVLAIIAREGLYRNRGNP